MVALCQKHGGYLPNKYSAKLCGLSVQCVMVTVYGYSWLQGMSWSQVTPGFANQVLVYAFVGFALHGACIWHSLSIVTMFHANPPVFLHCLHLRCVAAY